MEGLMVVRNVRRAPLGIVVVATLLLILGVGLVAGGAYLLLYDPTATAWAALSALVLGPATLYLTYHLVQLAPWTWLALVILIALLTLSTFIRGIVSPGIPIPAVIELLFEAGVLAYLTREPVRRAFGRTSENQ